MDLSKDITLSCQIGVSACLPYAGLKDISTGNLSVYDGSWTEFKTYYKEWILINLFENVIYHLWTIFPGKVYLIKIQ